MKRKNRTASGCLVGFLLHEQHDRVVTGHTAHPAGDGGMTGLLGGKAEKNTGCAEKSLQQKSKPRTLFLRNRAAKTAGAGHEPPPRGLSPRARKKRRGTAFPERSVRANEQAMEPERGCSGGVSAADGLQRPDRGECPGRERNTGGAGEAVSPVFLGERFCF